MGSYPESLAMPADEVLELHAARLLLLIKLCGAKGEKISGLTKLAKLDFFVRYPEFFYEVARYLGKDIVVENTQVESSMVRHHYGPWDKRYYHVLAYLEAKGLVGVVKNKKAYEFVLSELGKERGTILEKSESFSELTEHMKLVKSTLGQKNGSVLKDLIYKVFEKEVADRNLGEAI
ncbi:MAG: hypothetical protein OQL19_07100 [Gammaproteobacteria bacterium]|nr:hypothetical protein [Gammaproteobacteria bacterium]